MRGNKVDDNLIKMIGCNNNVLINSDFRNPINQRGITGNITNIAFAVDRWNAWATNGYLIHNTGYLTLYAKKVADARNSCHLSQIVEFPEIYVGRPMTISMRCRCTKDATYTMGLMDEITDPARNKALKGTGEWQVVSFTIPSAAPDSNGNITVMVSACKPDLNAETNHYGEVDMDTYLDVEWIKAEVGYFPTAYVPRLYAEELQLCQRYFWRLDDTIYGPYGTCGDFCRCDATHTWWNIKFPQTMRAKPVGTITLGSSALVFLFSGSYVSITGYTGLSTNLRTAFVTVTHQSVSDLNRQFMMQMANGFHIDFDAEL